MRGTAIAPRLAVFRSNRFVYAQLIDDDKGVTLICASTTKDKTKSSLLEKAKKMGLDIAANAKKKLITKVVFDRGGYIYTGKIRAVAEGAREGGLQF